MDGFDCLGAEVVGFDWGGAAQTAGGVISFATEAAEKDKAEKKSSADEKAALDKSIAADLAASNAVAKAAVSAKLKSPSASIDKTAAQSALAAQDKAGAALSADSASKRADAADKALDLAIKNAQAKPNDGYLAALVDAWTQTANKAHNVSITSSDDSGGGKKGKRGHDDGGGQSWFTRPVLGPIPGAGVLALGAGVLTGLGFLIRALVKR